MHSTLGAWIWAEVVGEGKGQRVGVAVSVTGCGVLIIKGLPFKERSIKPIFEGFCAWRG